MESWQCPGYSEEAPIVVEVVVAIEAVVVVVAQKQQAPPHLAFLPYTITAASAVQVLTRCRSCIS